MTVETFRRPTRVLRSYSLFRGGESLGETGRTRTGSPLSVPEPEEVSHKNKEESFERRKRRSKLQKVKDTSCSCMDERDTRRGKV